MKKIHKIFSFLTVLGIVAGSPFGIPVHAVSAEQSGFTQETLDFYQHWKEAYIRQEPYITDEEQYYVWYSEETYAGDEQSVAVTVSEAHGYGMLIFAQMAEQDESAKQYFDGMYRYYKAHPSSIGSYLMSWQQCDNGTALIDGAEDGSMTGGFCDSATDGDMDIAYSLLLAHENWGSDGEINYLESAKAMINDIMTYDVNHEYWTLTLGDWVSACDSSESYYHATRTSDFILSYLPEFAEVSGNPDWMKVYETTYGIITELTAEYQNGILPDFVIRDSDGSFRASPADFLESEHDGDYYYNACRTPWRISMDYLVNQNGTAKIYAEQISNFMKTATDSDPWEIMAGYHMDGTAFEEYSDLCFTAPVLLASKVAGDTQWHDQLRDVIVNYGDDVYYGDTIKLLCLMADDIENPENPGNPIRGDVNADGEFSLIDLIAMQKWLHHQGGLADWKAGDLDADGILTIYDFCRMKQELLK